MNIRFDQILKTAIATTVLLMFTVALISGQARADLDQRAAEGLSLATPVDVRIMHAIKHGPTAIVKGSLVKGSFELCLRSLRQLELEPRNTASR